MKETVSIIASKPMSIPRKTHNAHLSFMCPCLLINNEGMKEQGDTSDMLLSRGLGFSVFPLSSIMAA